VHAEAYAWVAAHATTAAVDVLDIGGRDINGTPRNLFFGATRYRCLDILDGPGVDIVADAATWRPDRAYGVVVCCEVFEHTDAWPLICATAYDALAPGGLLIATMAGPGRAPHSAYDGGPLREDEHYANVSAAELGDTLAACGFVDVVTDYQPGPGDTRATARRPGR
jgi:hypothetical protein